MMKTMKKVFAALLTLAMILCMCAVPAFAGTESDGSITINNAIAGQTYKIYKIADLESFNSTEGSEAYSYKAEGAWKNWLSSDGASIWVSVDSQDYITWKGNTKASTVQAFTTAALAHAKETDSGITGTSEKATSTSITFSGLSYGWYLIESPQGTIVAIQPAHPNKTINEKNEKPDAKKKIVENNNKVDSNDANIGDTVSYETTITVKDGAKNYVLHDKMSDGLTLNTDTISVNVNDSEVLASDTTFKIKTGNNTTDTDCDFEIIFNDSYVSGLSDNTSIVVKYSATLNANAVVAGEGNTNETYLKYGDTGETTHDKVTTKTWKFSVLKYTETTNNKLAGATFKLTKDSKDGTVVNVVAKSTGSTTYRPIIATETGSETITTTNTGEFTIEGLDSGTYYLTETKAPQGYNKLADSIKVVIGTDGSVKFDDAEEADSDEKVEVENKTGSELPSTGGIGTTIFYVIGGILVASAAVALVVKKRMSGYED